MTALRKEEQENVVHGHFRPMDIRSYDPVSCTVVKDSHSFETQLWSLSPMGCELLWDKSEVKLLEVLTIYLRIGSQEIEFSGIQVCEVRKGAKKIVGLRWVSRQVEPREHSQRRRRWLCSELYLPNVIAANPIQFNDFVYFRVINLSAGGALLRTSMRNKMIVKGLRLDGTWSFPMTGSCVQRFRVGWLKIVSERGHQMLDLGVEIEPNHSELYTQLCGDYVLQFGDVSSIREIKESGLRITNSSRALTVKNVNTEKEFKDVIELRRRSYAIYSQDKIPELSDVYDARARIIVAYHNGKAVGSCRLVFHGMEDELEQAQYVQLPLDFPKNHEIVEITRICVDPGYQSAAIVQEIFRVAVLRAIQTNRRYLVGSTPKKLAASYEALGAKTLDLSYSPESCPDLVLNICINDIEDIVAARSISPAIYQSVYKEVIDFAVEKDLINLPPATKLRHRLFGMLGKLSFRSKVKKK